MSAHSFGQTIERYTQAVDTKTAKYLRTALKRHVLEKMGYPTRGTTTTEFKQFCNNLTVEKLINDLKSIQPTTVEHLETPAAPNLADLFLWLFDRSFTADVNAGHASVATGHNYRSALGRFVEWFVKQSAWQLSCPSNMPEIRPKPLGNRQNPTIGKRRQPYSLRKEQLCDEQRQQLAEFKEFWTTGGEASWKLLRRERRDNNEREGRRPKVDRVRAEVFDEKYTHLILSFWGFLYNVRGHKLSELRLEMLTDSLLIDEYNDWLVGTRHTGHLTVIQLIAIGIAFCKQQHFNVVRRGRSWSDIDRIEELRAERSEYKERYKQEHKINSKVKRTSKNLSHEELERTCVYLYGCCAPYSGRIQESTGDRIKNARRSNSSIVWSWQVYLIVLIFTYTAVRQQEVRQYQEGETIFKEYDDQGQLHYVVRNIHHKQQRHTGTTREYCLPSIIQEPLDLWLEVYRPLAREAVQSLESWLAFVGYCPETLEMLQERLVQARQGHLQRSVKDLPRYIQGLENRLRAVQNRIAAWPAAKANFERHNSLFFSFGGSYPENFGTPLSSDSICSMVSGAVAEASKALFGRECRLNPHRFRHVAALHVRLIKGDKDGMGVMMNQSTEMGDDYAEQLQDDVVRTASLTDWWIPSTSK